MATEAERIECVARVMARSDADKRTPRMVRRRDEDGFWWIVPDKSDLVPKWQNFEKSAIRIVTALGDLG